MKNTDTGGGTRYSEGKVVQCWLPWKGLDWVWSVARAKGIENVDFGRNNEEALEAAETHMRCAMADPMAPHPGFSGAPFLAVAVYVLTVILHCEEEGLYITEYSPALLPAMGTEEACRVSERGAEKYAPLDWHVGQSWSTLLSSAMRHMKKALARGVLSRDEESGLMHIAHCQWNLLCLLHFMAEGRTDLDDVTPWRGVTATQKKEMGEGETPHDLNTRIEQMTKGDAVASAAFGATYDASDLD